MVKTFVICEAGSNHAGSLGNAKRLIQLAATAGAQACKFQFCSNYERFMERRKLTTKPYPFSIEESWLNELNAVCAAHGIEFLCTVYLPEDVKVIGPFVSKFKVSAFERDDSTMILEMHNYGKTMLVSNGWGYGLRLYCVSEYPCPDEHLHLIKMTEGDVYSDGLSDHTKSLITGALAVALQAEYIETHFRLWDTPTTCPDYDVARDPDELVEYIRNIRQAEVLMYGQP